MVDAVIPAPEVVEKKKPGPKPKPKLYVTKRFKNLSREDRNIPGVGNLSSGQTSKPIRANIADQIASTPSVAQAIRSGFLSCD